MGDEEQWRQKERGSHLHLLRGQAGHCFVSEGSKRYRRRVHTAKALCSCLPAPIPSGAMAADLRLGLLPLPAHSYTPVAARAGTSHLLSASKAGEDTWLASQEYKKTLRTVSALINANFSGHTFHCYYFVC